MNFSRFSLRFLYQILQAVGVSNESLRKRGETKKGVQGSSLSLFLPPRPPLAPPFPPPRMPASESSARLALEREEEEELEEAEGPPSALEGSSGIGEGGAPPVVAVEVEADDESGGSGFAAASLLPSTLRGGSENETADAEVALLR